MTSRRGSTIFFLLVVAGAIIYFWYDGKLPFFQGKSFNLNILPSDLSSFTQKTGNIVKDIKNRGNAAVKDVIKIAAEKPKEIAGNVINDAKKSVADSFKKQIAETLGIISGADAVPIKNVAIVRQVSQGLSLSIESDEVGIKYSVNWGDGTVVGGVLDLKQQKNLDHNWKEAGDYSVTVETEGVKDGQKKTFVFPLKILR